MALDYISGGTSGDRIQDSFGKTNEAISNIIVSASTSGNTLSLTTFGGGVISTDIRPYKVYTALLTQNTVTYTSEEDLAPAELSNGMVFKVITKEAGDVFPYLDDSNNLAYADVNQTFVFSTEAAQSGNWNWKSGSVLLDVIESSPKADVLENTLGIDVDWRIISTGSYIAVEAGQPYNMSANIDNMYEGGSVDVKKVYYDVVNTKLQDLSYALKLVHTMLGNGIPAIRTTDPDNLVIDNMLDLTPVEIRVYN